MLLRSIACLDSRPGLAALLDRIESNGVKVVIVERADRLARDLMVSEVILAQLAQAGAKVITSDGADLSSAADDPTRTLIRQVLSAVAQFDKSVTVLKLCAARERLRRKGHRVEGRKHTDSGQTSMRSSSTCGPCGPGLAGND